jgi:hypothetical protein
MLPRIFPDPSCSFQEIVSYSKAYNLPSFKFKRNRKMHSEVLPLSKERLIKKRLVLRKFEKKKRD